MIEIIVNVTKSSSEALIYECRSHRRKLSKTIKGASKRFYLLAALILLTLHMSHLI